MRQNPDQISGQDTDPNTEPALAPNRVHQSQSLNANLIEIPEFALVMLVGISGSGKSSFASKHFRATEVVSSDACRALVGDDENDQAVSEDAFGLLREIASRRLKHRRLTVLDATHVQPGARPPVLALARDYDTLPVAIVFDLPLELCQARNAERPDRAFGPHVLPNQQRMLRQTLKRLRREGFRQIHVLNSPEAIEAVRIERMPLWCDQRDDAGPFDIIGDVHGCCDELETLLVKLGYTHVGDLLYQPPEGRRALFLGDLVDRGPRNLDSLFLARNMVAKGYALCIPGNHEAKFMKVLLGKKVTLKHGIEKSVAELDALPEPERRRVVEEAKVFIDSLVSHLVLDQGRLVVAHAGMRQNYQGRASGRVRSFALYGDTTGEIDSFGLPVRLDWAAEYRGSAMVVYGHVPVPEPEWVNNTIDIDQGCVFGGKLTALRYPERELVSVPAQAVYYQPIKPMLSQSDTRSLQHQLDDVLDWSEVAGKQLIPTRLQRLITIQAEQSAAALEVLSRYAVDPKWLVYLPPTMSPSETAEHPDYLEYPTEAFAYFKRQGVTQVVCQQKHMGSRAIMVVCREPAVACTRFGLAEPAAGVIYTRTGRPFFRQRADEDALLDATREALSTAGIFDELESDWVVLDLEIMPWSAKASDLVERQYAAVGTAASASLQALTGVLSQAAGRLPELSGLLEQQTERLRLVDLYREAYGQYCWPVTSLSDYKLAPFHLLASEGTVHTDKPHAWHLDMLCRLSEANSRLFIPTGHQFVDLHDETSVQSATDWWLALTAAGGEGMVVKPADFIVKGPRGWVQPALKCRGREYLRIIYGPDYTLPEHLSRLKKRGLSAKRSLAMREFALGLEGLERLVRREPLRKIHACVAGVLALESEPVDPRL